MKYIFIASGQPDKIITREEAKELVVGDYNNGEKVFEELEKNGGDLRLVFGYLRIEKNKEEKVVKK